MNLCFSVQTTLTSLGSAVQLKNKDAKTLTAVISNQAKSFLTFVKMAQDYSCANSVFKRV